MLAKGTLIGAGIVAAGLAAFFGAKALTGSFVGDSSGGSNQHPPIAGITVPPVPPPPEWSAPQRNSDSEGNGTKGISSDQTGSTEMEPEPPAEESPIYPTPPPPEEEPTPPASQPEEGNGGSDESSGGGWVTGGRAGG